VRVPLRRCSGLCYNPAVARAFAPGLGVYNGTALRYLWEESGLRLQPEPLTCAIAQAILAQSPEGARHDRRRAAARQRVHGLPEVTPRGPGRLAWMAPQRSSYDAANAAFTASAFNR